MTQGLKPIIRGPQGEQGATGATGATGAAGANGSNGTNGTNGTNGDSSYTYIAYASDASGTGFTTTFNASLDYIAIKTTTSPIASPSAGDFSGLWKNYKGATGEAGEDGDAGSGFLRNGLLEGGDVSNAADAEHDITTQPGHWGSDDADPADRVLMSLSSAITKRIDANWAVGDGNGGLDTGSVANGTWYYEWIIQRPDTGVVDVLLSASATSPTMPANYTKKCRQRYGMAFLTNGSANIIAFKNVRARVSWSAVVTDYTSTSPPTTDALIYVTVPLAENVIWRGIGENTNSGGAARISVADGNLSAGLLAGIQSRAASGTSLNVLQGEILAINGQVLLDASSSTGWSFNSIFTQGWDCL